MLQFVLIGLMFYDVYAVSSSVLSQYSESILNPVHQRSADNRIIALLQSIQSGDLEGRI